ncbi:MAG: hypothetical protein FJ117_19565, partial [Deltaproteobacteria bacterium]|nr:hypothetical protein [Deltaproteobacteria bacterium]
MAEKKRTTKEILQEKLTGGKGIPLYNPEALKRLCQEFEQWRSTMVGEEDRKNWCVTPHTILGSEIPRE